MAALKMKSASVAIGEFFEDLQNQCSDVGLKVSAALIANRKEYYGSKSVAMTGTEFSTDMEHLAETIRIEMSQVQFMYMPAEQAAFYNQKELFGQDVNAKFPGIQFDIVEAGNCYATGRGTACVFHLMRIMETGVQEFGAKLGVTLVNEKNWQNILDEINKSIKALPKSSATVEMSQASANLYAVKLAWRNEVMHPKDTYTLEEADSLIRQVRLFMQQLAKIV